MKTTTDTHVMLKAIDIELRALLQQDLKQYKAAKENKQAYVKKAA